MAGSKSSQFSNLTKTSFHISVLKHFFPFAMFLKEKIPHRLDSNYFYRLIYVGACV